MTEDEVPQEIADMIARYAKVIQEGSAETLKNRREYRTEFKDRLRTYWGPALDLYEVLSACLLEVGSVLVERAPETDAALFRALTATHAKACRVADEVCVLLTNGHGAGALGRCRTLHELAVIAHLLWQYDGSTEFPDLAKRYLTYEGWTKDQGDFGWASGISGKARPTFATLEQAADLGHARPYFRLASHEIHADPEGLRSNLFARGEKSFALAGPTNAFLSRPGQLGLIFLYQVTTALSAAYPDAMAAAMLGAIEQRLPEAYEAFDAAEREVVQAEKDYQNRVARGPEGV